MPRVGLIAALEREVAPLTRTFTRRIHPGKSFAVFQREETWLIPAGIGAKHAAAAAEWLIASCNAEIVMSIGFAGALAPGLKAGDVIIPATVIDGGTGERFSAVGGRTVLVTATGVLSKSDKQALARKFHADAVDMEAAAVARVAQQSGVAFFAVKAISDEAGVDMPPLERFVDDKGKFRDSKLLAYAAVRPAIWPVLGRLGVNAKKASSQLSRWLENQISRDFRDILDVVSLRARS